VGSASLAGLVIAETRMGLQGIASIRGSDLYVVSRCPTRRLTGRGPTLPARTRAVLWKREVGESWVHGGRQKEPCLRSLLILAAENYDLLFRHHLVPDFCEPWRNSVAEGRDVSETPRDCSWAAPAGSGRSAAPALWSGQGAPCRGGPFLPPPHSAHSLPGSGLRFRTRGPFQIPAIKEPLLSP
jgi:hypothetical protein